MLACGGYLYLAYASLPARGASNVGDVLGKVLRLLSVSGNGVKTNGYLAAAVLCFGTAAFTSVMVPTNFALIEKNEQQGGARSQANAQNSSSGGKSRSANESVSGEGQESQFTDLSGPQTKTSRESSEEEDREVQALLERFGKLNLVRAGLLGAGGVVGLWTALA